MAMRKSYIEEIQDGVVLLKRHYEEIRAFAERHRSCASAFLHAAAFGEPDTGIAQSPGVRDAAELLHRVGPENGWLLNAVVSAYCGRGVNRAA